MFRSYCERTRKVCRPDKLAIWQLAVEIGLYKRDVQSLRARCMRGFNFVMRGPITISPATEIQHTDICSVSYGACQTAYRQ